MFQSSHHALKETGNEYYMENWVGGRTGEKFGEPVINES